MIEEISPVVSVYLGRLRKGNLKMRTVLRGDRERHTAYNFSPINPTPAATITIAPPTKIATSPLMSCSPHNGNKNSPGKCVLLYSLTTSALVLNTVIPNKIIRIVKATRADSNRRTALELLLSWEKVDGISVCEEGTGEGEREVTVGSSWWDCLSWSWSRTDMMTRVPRFGGGMVTVLFFF